MTKSVLNPDQCRVVEIIQALGFGVIEGLLVRSGLPCFEPEPNGAGDQVGFRSSGQADHLKPTSR